MPSPETIFLALSGGILPALLWLWFWLQEDRLHPEPRGMIIRAFIFGMIAVPLALPFEQAAQNSFCAGIQNVSLCSNGILVIFLWAASEELLKFVVAFFSALDTKEYDEPIDAVIYLLTVALGFAAMENTLFLISSISNTTPVVSLVTGNLRFIGATLLHVLSSGVIGLFLGLSFCKSRFAKAGYLFLGIGLAIVLHTVFNIFIMNYSSGTETFVVFGHAWAVSKIFIIFAFVWLAILLLIAGFEKVKQIQRCRLP